MKTKKEIEERIDDIQLARADLNDRGNLSKECFEEFRVKLQILRWVIE